MKLLLHSIKTNYKTYAYLLFYICCFIFLIQIEAIYTPDSGSYFAGSIWRSAGYPVFLVVFKLISRVYLNPLVITTQLVLGFVAIHCFAKQISLLLGLKPIFKGLFIVVLILPYFSPLYIANNICPEGLSYPLYLFTLYFGLRFLFLEQNFKLLLASLLLLLLTRQQFIVLPLIIAVCYFLKHRTHFNLKTHALKIISLILILAVNTLADRTFHKLRSDLFVPTAFTYINLNSAAIYVSTESDINSIENKNDRAIFKQSYTMASKNGWLQENKTLNNYEDYYEDFQKNLDKICSGSLHKPGSDYYLEKGYEYDNSRAQVEVSAKAFYPILVKNNFWKYVQLIYASVIHGLKSHVLFWLILIVLFVSCFKTLLHYKPHRLLLLFIATLILSNVLIVSLASYSVMRLEFYHYPLIVIFFFTIIKITVKKNTITDYFFTNK